MEDDNTKEIAKAIFSKPPGAVNSIDLSLEDETSDIAEECGIDEFVTNILRIITMHGIYILFGVQDLTELIYLSENEILLIKEYTRSYGYNLKIELNESDRILYIAFVRTLDI